MTEHNPETCDLCRWERDPNRMDWRSLFVITLHVHGGPALVRLCGRPQHRAFWGRLYRMRRDNYNKSTDIAGLL